MDKYRKSNLSFLQTNFPNIYELCIKTQYVVGETVFVEWARNEEAILVSREDGREAYVHSRYNPSHEASKWVEQNETELQQKKHVLLFGLGFGYHLQALLECCPDKIFYIVEPNIEVFQRYIEAKPIHKILKNKNIAALAIGDTDSVFSGVFHLIAENVDEGFVLLASPYYQKNNKESLQTLINRGETVLKQYRSELHTHFYFKETWPMNIISNYPKVTEALAFDKLVKKYENVPAIIVGSGPSLQYDLKAIKASKGKSLIIAAGSSIQPLAANGIMPDLVVSMDGGHANYRAFSHVDLTDTPLLFCPIIQKDILDKPIKRLIYADLKDNSITPYLLGGDKTETTFYSTMSVTGIAMQAAHQMGCNPIILTGQDMSFPNGRHYASGTTHFTEKFVRRKVRDANETVENVHGSTNLTSQKMNLVLKDIEMVIKMLLRDVQVINTSAGGAKIQGTYFRTMDDVCEEYIRNRNGKIDFNEMLSSLGESQRSLAHNRKAEARLKEFLAELHRINQITHQLIQIFKECSRVIQRKDRLKCGQKLQEINILWTDLNNSKTLSEALSMVVNLQRMLILRKFQSIQKERDPLMKLEQTTEHVGRYVAGLNELLPNLIRWTEEAAIRLSNYAIQSTTD